MQSSHLDELLTSPAGAARADIMPSAPGNAATAAGDSHATGSDGRHYLLVQLGISQRSRRPSDVPHARLCALQASSANGQVGERNGKLLLRTLLGLMQHR